MRLKYKYCENDDLVFLGMPIHVRWICPECGKVSDNFDQDIKEMNMHFLRGGINLND